MLGSIDAYQIQAEAQGAQLDVYRFEELLGEGYFD